MAARDMVYVPTVWAFSDDSGLDDSTMSADELRELARWQAEHQASVRRARDAGVRIAAGSDSADVVTGRGVLAKEILALERCGLSRSEALRAATATAAHLIGRPDLGRATEGATAHLVVLTGNPLEDLAVLERPAAVIKDGRLVFDREHGVQPPYAPAGRPLSTTARWSS
jgi:imidazolonepropionase-like amidohydrolase